MRGDYSLVRIGVMDINEALEADWIKIRAILKEQAKGLAQGQRISVVGLSAEAAQADALDRAHRLIAECEAVILMYSRKV
jgi:hypothetical protein